MQVTILCFLSTKNSRDNRIYFINLLYDELNLYIML